MPPPNNPLPAEVVDTALTGAATSNPPPPEESRFEAALCLMNLVQRPLATSATTPSPVDQPTKQSSLSVVNPTPAPVSSIVGSSTSQSTSDNIKTCQPIQAAHPAPFQIGTTHPASTTAINKPTTKKKKRVRLNYICTIPNCTNLVRKSGVCIRHGAQVKLCSFPQCTNHAKNGGVCRRHGASRPCGRTGCGNMVVKRGLCIKHWREEQQNDIVEVGVGVEGSSVVKKREGMEFLKLQSSQGEEREREIAVAKLLAGQRSSGNI